MSKQVKLVSSQIHVLLRRKHVEDVYVSECKIGPSPCPRLDAWAMRKSWTHPCAIGYEIKVDRSDFLNDKKWPEYLPFCHEFYFVCTSGLITKEEISPEVGLMWVAESGNVLYTKKKAPYRKVTIPSTLYEYLLMARIKISCEMGSQVELYQNWFENSEANTELGREIARKIRKKVDNEVGNLRQHNKQLEQHLEQLEAAERVLKELNIDVDRTYVGDFKKKLKEVLNGIPADFEMSIHNAHSYLGQLLNQLKKQSEEKE